MSKLPNGQYQFGRLSAGERIQAYRGFLIARRNDGRASVRWQIKANPWIPRSFLWAGTNDDLNTYLEALINQDERTKGEMETQGMATGHVYPSTEEIQATGPMIEVSPERLVAVMLGIDKLCIPANGSLTVRQHGHRYWAGNVQALLIAKGVLPAPTREELRQAVLLPKFPAKPHTGINLTSTPQSAVDLKFGIQEENPQEQTSRNEKEVPILKKKHRYHRETVNLVASSPPYYVRRMFKDRDMIYLATSWSPKGPWDVLHQDEVRCKLLTDAESAA
jgi:hypothetical protein